MPADTPTLLTPQLVGVVVGAIIGFLSAVLVVLLTHRLTLRRERQLRDERRVQEESDNLRSRLILNVSEAAESDARSRAPFAASTGLRHPNIDQAMDMQFLEAVRVIAAYLTDSSPAQARAERIIIDQLEAVKSLASRDEP